MCCFSLFLIPICDKIPSANIRFFSISDAIASINISLYYLFLFFHFHYLLGKGGYVFGSVVSYLLGKGDYVFGSVG